MTERELLIAQLSDKLRLCLSREVITFSGFLDAASKSEAKRFCERQKASAVFFGGYAGAEREACVFLPEYLSPDMFPKYFAENPDDCPVKAVRCTSAAGSPPLSHRDFLGSLLSLGIRRESVGDILVSENSADIFVLPPLASFLISDYKRAGRVPINVSEIPPSEAAVPTANVAHMRDTVPSLRLDAAVSSVFSLSRTKAAEAILSGLVFVNDAVREKPDSKISAGDKLVLRGHGKAVITASDELTKKGRTVILFDKYL